MRLLGEVNVSEYLVTGNEYVSLPTIRQRDGAIESLSFLHMGAKGMIELCGNSDKPLIAPFAEINGLSLPEAVGAAKEYVFEGIAHAEPIGKGHGPIHHFYELYKKAGWTK